MIGDFKKKQTVEISDINAYAKADCASWGSAQGYISEKCVFVV